MSDTPPWQPIEDLPPEWETLVCPEIASLKEIWRETRDDLPESAVEHFNRQLSREWAIQTGLIEGLYVLDRGTTNTLIELGLDAAVDVNAGNRDAEVRGLLKDQEGALDLIFDVVKNDRSLGTSFVKELHALLTRHQPSTTAVDSLGQHRSVKLLQGAYKTLPNNPTQPDGSLHAYCPPEQTSAEMDQLLAWHTEHEQGGVQPEVEAAWLHHRFTQIHPFQDGNGRVARCLASLVLIKGELFPLVVEGDHHKIDYIGALESADRGELAPLVDLFASIQRKRLRKAISIADQAVSGTRQLSEVVRSFSRLGTTNQERYGAALDLGAELNDMARAKLHELRGAVEKSSAGAVRAWQLSSVGHEDQRSYNRYQKTRMARALEYFANYPALDEWSSLSVAREDRHLELLVAVHGVGTTFRGVIAVAVSVYERATSEEAGTRLVADLKVIGREPFLINHLDAPSEVEPRFAAWLDSHLSLGLAELRDRL